MKITVLIENTPGENSCTALHGLSFYIESKKHKILFDSGPSPQTLDNAKKLGIDLTQVDIAILSHGHYDHSGGLLAFAELNPKAKIYMQREAGGQNYAFDGPEKGYRYIGIDKKILELPQLVLLDGDIKIDQEISLFTLEKRKFPLPSTNKRIVKKIGGGTDPSNISKPLGTDPSNLENANFIQDDFTHEHYLFIDDGKSQRALISGCAHNGILNIMEEFIRKYGKENLPDQVISGFHLLKKSGYLESDFEEDRQIAELLKNYPCKFYTCHCTGLEPYQEMKKIMGRQLEYLHTGNCIE
ncbi:MAG: MBL fold metallo-hydrolase [Treponema sp.]|nr:MBL fold metallo-hydrolase [Treponema sp.]